MADAAHLADACGPVREADEGKPPSGEVVSGAANSAVTGIALPCRSVDWYMMRYICTPGGASGIRCALTNVPGSPGCHDCTL